MAGDQSGFQNLTKVANAWRSQTEGFANQDLILARRFKVAPGYWDLAGPALAVAAILKTQKKIAYLSPSTR